MTHLDESEKQSSKDIFPPTDNSAQAIQEQNPDIDEQALRRVIRKVSST